MLFDTLLCKFAEMSVALLPSVRDQVMMRLGQARTEYGLFCCRRYSNTMAEPSSAVLFLAFSLVGAMILGCEEISRAQ